MGLLHHPCWLQLVLGTFGPSFSMFETTLFGEESLTRVHYPMRIWSILLMKSDLKWCIHLSRSLLYFNLLKTLSSADLLEKVYKQAHGHEYFIPTKFCKHPSSGSVVKTDYVSPKIYMHTLTPFLHVNECIKKSFKFASIQIFHISTLPFINMEITYY